MIGLIEFMNRQVAEYLQQLERRIANTGAATAKAEAQADFALCQFRAGEIDSARATLDEVFALGLTLDRAEQARVTAIALCGEAVMLSHRGRYPEAVSQFLHTVEVAQTAGMPHIRARALAFLAVACGRLGAHRDGLEYGLAGLDAGIETNDLRAIVTARMAIANLHNEREQSDLALRYLREVTELAEALGDPFTLGAVKSSLASSSCNYATTLAAKSTNDALSIKDLNQALREAKKLGEDSLVHARASGYVFAELCALGNLAEVAFMEGKIDDAVVMIGQAFAIGVKLDSINNMAFSLLVWGGYDLHAGRVDEATRRLNEGLKYAKQAGYLEAEAKIQQKLSECYQKQGRLHDALDAQKRFATVLESQRLAELANLAVLTEAKREFQSARGSSPSLADNY